MIYRMFKGWLDKLLALTGLVVLSPFLVVIMIILRLSGEGEVFYLQDRVGFRNRIFKIWKFATMLKGSPLMGTGSLTLRQDPRVLPFGKWLRATKINELPQLVNVLKGDMSLVGPRPQVKEDFEAYPPHIQDRIYDVKPGITSLASVVYRDEEALISGEGVDAREIYRNRIAPHKGAIEIWYQGYAGPVNDLIIIFLTFWYILFPKSNLVYKIFRQMPKRKIYE